MGILIYVGLVLFVSIMIVHLMTQDIHSQVDKRGSLGEFNELKRLRESYARNLRLKKERDVYLRQLHTHKYRENYGWKDYKEN